MDENSIYHYYYIVTNPQENQIGLHRIAIDITMPNHGVDPGYIFADGYAQPDNITPSQAQRRGLLYAPVAWKNTTLWKGSVGLEDGRWSLAGDSAVIGWRARYDFSTKYQYLLNPSATSEELESISFGLPGIRKVVFRPDWLKLNLPPEYLRLEGDSLEVWLEKDRKKETLSCVATTVGPTAPPAYTPLQFNQMMQEYVTQSVNLG